MQTKSSFRVVKWSLLAAVVASLASACVVTSGDGDIDDNFGEGGDGGTNSNTAGTKSAGSSNGGSSNGGTKSDAGETGSDGGTPGMGMAGSGNPGTFVPGECQVDEPLNSNGTLALCDEAAGDDDCTKCLKDKVCPEYMACFGTDPATAPARDATLELLAKELF